jgi:hypothetical protein
MKDATEDVAEGAKVDHRDRPDHRDRKVAHKGQKVVHKGRTDHRERVLLQKK